MTDFGLTLEQYNEALTQGQLLVTRCAHCGAQDALPTSWCFRCGRRELETHVHTGAASVFSWVVCHYAFDPALTAEVPYTVLVVELQGGGRVYGRLDSADTSQPIRAGLEVELLPTVTRERRYPVFRIRR